MATRAASHTGGADTAAAQPPSISTTSHASSVESALNSAAAGHQLTPQVTLDASAYEPSTSAYANATAVAASTAVLTATPTHQHQAPPLSSTVAGVVTRRAPMTPTPPAPPLAISRSSSRLVSGARHSSKFGTVNYSIDEMRRLVDKVRAVMPIASEDWLHVAYQFNYMRPESIPYREVESLKRKFKKMYCSRSTVVGELPDYVQQAKDLRKLINQRSERAQIQLEHVHSDSQSEIDAHDVAPMHGDEATTAVAVAVAVPAGSEDSAIDAATGGSGVASVVLSMDQSGASAGDVEMAADGASDDTRDIAARLRVMEEEYHRSTAVRRGSGALTAGSVDSASFASAANGGGSTIYGDSTSGLALSGDSTAGIIDLLKHSIERKRRTIEEQMLSESERVRKERKKRKMEQVLYNIHREQSAGTAAASELVGSGPPASPSDAMGGSFHQPPHPAFSSVPSTQDVASSLGLMEIVLQYMVSQQQETARRIQQEEERRRREDDARDRRRRAGEAQKRRDKHEMMLVMAALLQENFPVELRQYLEPSSLHARDDEVATEGEETTATSSSIPLPKQSKPPPESSVMDAAEEALL